MLTVSVISHVTFFVEFVLPVVSTFSFTVNVAWHLVHFGWALFFSKYEWVWPICSRISFSSSFFPFLDICSHSPRNSLIARRLLFVLFVRRYSPFLLNLTVSRTFSGRYPRQTGCLIGSFLSLCRGESGRILPP